MVRVMIVPMLLHTNCVLAASNGDNFFSRSTDDAEKQGDDDHKNVLLCWNENKKACICVLAI